MVVAPIFNRQAVRLSTALGSRRTPGVFRVFRASRGSSPLRLLMWQAGPSQFQETIFALFLRHFAPF